MLWCPNSSGKAAELMFKYQMCQIILFKIPLHIPNRGACLKHKCRCPLFQIHKANISMIEHFIKL